MAGHLRGSRQRRRARYLLVESLEDRVLLSSSPPVLGPPAPPAPDFSLASALAEVLAGDRPDAASLTGSVTVAGDSAPGVGQPPASSPDAPLLPRDAWLADAAPKWIDFPAAGLPDSALGVDFLALSGPLTAAAGSTLPLDVSSLSAPAPVPDGAFRDAWVQSRLGDGTWPRADLAAPAWTITGMDHLTLGQVRIPSPVADGPLSAGQPDGAWQILGAAYAHGLGEEIGEMRAVLLQQLGPSATGVGPAHGNFAGPNPLHLALQAVGPVGTPDTTGPLAPGLSAEVSPPVASLPAPAEEAHRPAAEHALVPAERSARPEVVEPVRAPAEAVVAPRAEGGSDPASRESGRAVPFGPAPALPGPVAVLVDAVGGPAAREAERVAAAVLLTGGTGPAGAPGRVVVPGVAQGAGGATPGGEPDDLPATVLARPEALDLPAQAAVLLEGGLPLDLPVLAQDVDAFFARLGSLGEGRGGVSAWGRFAPWLVVLSAAAFEIARRHEKKSARWPAGDELLHGPAAFLPEQD